jgi:hypothetical protein
MKKKPAKFNNTNFYHEEEIELNEKMEYYYKVECNNNK